MIEQQTGAIEELLLQNEDFPDEYVHMAHPEDYKCVAEFKPQFTVHSRFGRHNRLIVRAAWKLPNNGVIPMSFVCDTGAPSHVYMSNRAISTMHKFGLLLKDDRDTPYVRVHTDSSGSFSATVEETPRQHRDANILGLKSLMKLNMHLADGGFNFNHRFVYL